MVRALVSPLWAEPLPEPAPTELNLDTGSKKGIASVVASSPLRYSTAFTSRVPRLGGREEGPRSPDKFYKEVRSAACTVKEPSRNHVVFRSNVSRFTGGSGMFARGMHPNMQMAQPSFEVGKSTKLDADEAYRSRHGFFRSSAPRLRPIARPLTADLEPLDYVAGAHVESAHLSLTQTVTVSPRRLKVMSSRTSRFASAPASPLQAAGLGPGSYEPHEPRSPSTASKPNCVFASKSPRLVKQRMPLSVGGNVASVELDRSSWSEPHAFVPKAKRGLDVRGPQLGSYEGQEGLSRCVSPVLRSPDKEYTLEHSAQKRPLSLEMEASALRYSPAFRSHQSRLQLALDEKRSLEYPPNSADPLDLSASASRSSFGQSSPAFARSQEAKDGAKDGAAAIFGSTAPRFPSIRLPDGRGAPSDCFEADRKTWHAMGQPLTSQEQRFQVHETPDGEVSPGPGTYVGQKVWDVASPAASAKGGHTSARRRLEL